MKTQTIDYVHAGKTHVGFLAWDNSVAGRRPGILVFPEAFGLNDHARTYAQRLARLGYVALAVDPHGGGFVYENLASLGPAIQALYADRALWRSQARTAFDVLADLPQVDSGRIAAVGYCFGGASCFELARSGAPLAAIATFHAGIAPALAEDIGCITAKVLICHGAEDPVIKPGVIDAVLSELRQGQVDWQFISYGNTAHSFTDPEADKRAMPGFAYSKVAENRSWLAMQALFAEVFT